MRNLTLHKWLLCLLLLIIPSTLSAANESLKLMLSELTASFSIVAEAQRNTDRQSRFSFQYPALRHDMTVIKQGLNAAVYGAEQTGFVAQALRLQYGHAGGINESRLLQLLITELKRIQNTSNRFKQSSKTVNARGSVDINLIASDLAAVIDAIRLAIQASGEVPRRFTNPVPRFQ